MIMSETELSVICKNCGSEVSPYVTECPYCGARLRKRAPKLERRGDVLEPKPRRRPQRMCPKQPEVIEALRKAHGLIGPAALQLLNIHTMGDLVSHTEAELMGVKNFGATSLTEVKQKLVEMGLE